MATRSTPTHPTNHQCRYRLAEYGESQTISHRSDDSLQALNGSLVEKLSTPITSSINKSQYQMPLDQEHHDMPRQLRYRIAQVLDLIEIGSHLPQISKPPARNAYGYLQVPMYAPEILLDGIDTRNHQHKDIQSLQHHKVKPADSIEAYEQQAASNMNWQSPMFTNSPNRSIEVANTYAAMHQHDHRSAPQQHDRKNASKSRRNIPSR